MQSLTYWLLGVAAICTTTAILQLLYTHKSLLNNLVASIDYYSYIRTMKTTAINIGS